ncbi:MULTISPECIES: DUF4430 domain-containing protein [Virgibacillus]|uniref:Transcobalamin-like C-terminal domain-containing protein n=2 Tax=Virgibacillus TaxID=84406 RepID=A0A024QC28_9BACI|nr:MULTISPECIES: DUF4430 domain-containing protein [Virgibacillus]EQB36075.1 hypothetical protein M948_13645 [Virgibacillus sp. CM-4]MYL41940.1 DUF4430 domain-containing protein [Virgibacillus massiliensis]GGJ46849.1 hypothetical protein GCM10007111_06060 [Virgibacillus kapii]CDQ39770.1 hypothetical protein BN990_02084 [Virgibacillus massiliensis]
MKTWLKRFVPILVILVFITGCGTEEQGAPAEPNQTSENQQTQTEQNEEKVLITISKDNGEEYLHEKEIPIEEGAILMDVMEENFYIETEQDGTFITSIERLSAKEGEQKGWVYTVNGDMPTVGAAEYKLKPDDKVVFDFQAWE